MIKATVIKPLNNRLYAPEVNAEKKKPFEKDEEVEVEAITIGDVYDNNNVWYKLTDNSYVWSGAVSIDKKLSKLPVIENAWHIEKMGIKDIWEKTKGAGVKVAVLDSGLNTDHPLIDKDRIIATKNFLYSGDDLKKQADVADLDGHGSHCAGIIAAQKLCGVAPECELIIGKVYEKALDPCDENTLLDAIEWAIKSGAKIISISLIIPEVNDETVSRLREICNRNSVILICSLMNTELRFMAINLFPSDYKDCIAVGASDEQSDMYKETPWSDKADLVAPGVNITSLAKDSYYKIDSGCSMATPYVAGMMALYLSLNQSVNEMDKQRASFLSLHKEYIPVYEKEEILYPIINPKSLIL